MVFGFFGLPSGLEFIVILGLGLLLFGGRLPEVGRSLGRSLMEFRKGLRGLKEEAGLGEIEDLRHDLTDLDHLDPMAEAMADLDSEVSPGPSSSSELDEAIDVDQGPSEDDGSPEDEAAEDEAARDEAAEAAPSEDRSEAETPQPRADVDG